MNSVNGMLYHMGLAFASYTPKILDKIKIIFSKPENIILSLAPSITIPEAATVIDSKFSTFQYTLILLGVLFVADFATGIMASYFEFKKAKQVTPEDGGLFIQSQKLRLSGAKLISYGLGIIVAYWIEFIFINGDFKISNSIKNLTLSTIVAMFFCSIEIYSIFFENFKRMGFDLLAKFKKIFSTGVEIVDTIKNTNEKTE